MTIAIAPAVVATCSYCLEQSRPCSENEAKAFLGYHIDQHYGKARFEVMKRHGHKIETKGWVDHDDSHVHIECSCGHIGPTSKLNYMNAHADEHLVPLADPFEDEIQEELARMKKLDLPPTA